MNNSRTPPACNPPQPPSAKPVPALLFGEGVALLGALRGLGEAGIPALVANTPGLFVRRSKYYHRAPGAALRTSSSATLAEDLERLPFDRAVLIPCSDSSAVAVAGLPSALGDRFPTSCATAEIQVVLADKLKFSKILQEMQLPHPRTLELTSREIISDMSEQELARFFLKPLDSESFSKHYGIKACLLSGKADALENFDRLSADGYAVVLQEYIPGPPTEHYFIDGIVDRHGRIRTRFARRRIRMYPPLLGNSSCLVSIPLTEVAAASAVLDRLLGELEFRGIFSAEFKRDPADGVCKLLEINARPWWYIGFAHTCAVNVAAMAYWDALGFDVPEVTEYRIGRACVYPVMDFKAGVAEIRAGRLSPWALASSWLNRDDPIASWRDPGPGLSEFFRLIPHMTKKIFGVGEQ